MKARAFLLLALSCSFLFLAHPLQAQVFVYTGDPTFAADFNLDGKMDLFSIGGSMNLGRGDGTFEAATQVILPANVLAVADFNGDSKPDLVVGPICKTTACDNSLLGVMLGKGDATFQTAINSAINWSAVAVADLNGDAKPDLVVVFSDMVFVYLGRGDGTFEPGRSYNPGCYPQPNHPENGCLPEAKLSLGDFNGDGYTDAVVSTAPEFFGDPPPYGQEIVLLGDGDGTFQPAVASDGVYPILGNIVVGDFNGDGKLDLAASGGIYDSSRVTWVLLGNGDGTFTTGGIFGDQLPRLSTGVTLTAGDFNNDGKNDLVAQGDPYGSDYVQIYLGLEDGTFSKIATYGLSQQNKGDTLGVSIADFNDDGKQDIAADNLVLLGNGDGTFRMSLPFAFSAATGVASTSVGGTASYDLQLFVLDFTGTASLSCTVIPNVSRSPSCALSSSSVQLSPGDIQNVHVTVATTAPTTAASIPPVVPRIRMWLTSFLICVCSVVVLLRIRQCKLALVSAFATVLMLPACGGSGSRPSQPLLPNPGTPVGTYTITVTGTSGTQSQSIALTLTVS